MARGHVCSQEATAVAQQEAKSPMTVKVQSSLHSGKKEDSQEDVVLARSDFSHRPSHHSMSGEKRATTLIPKQQINNHYVA